MTPVISPVQAALDALACMGLGLFIAALRCLFPLRRSPLAFWADFFGAGAALILLQGYAAGRSNAGELRWYMLAAAAVGAFAAVRLLAPARKALCCGVRRTAGIPVRFVKKRVLGPAAQAWSTRKNRKKTEQRQKNVTKGPKKQLQTTPELLYNSNI